MVRYAQTARSKLLCILVHHGPAAGSTETRPSITHLLRGTGCLCLHLNPTHKASHGYMHCFTVMLLRIPVGTASTVLTRSSTCVAGHVVQAAPVATLMAV